MVSPVRVTRLVLEDFYDSRKEFETGKGHVRILPHIIYLISRVVSDIEVGFFFRCGGRVALLQISYLKVCSEFPACMLGDAKARAILASATTLFVQLSAEPDDLPGVPWPEVSWLQRDPELRVAQKKAGHAGLFHAGQGNPNLP